MAHPFEIQLEIETDATPEQAWDAIATGPGIDGWFMGRSVVQPGVGGLISTAMPGFTMESTIVTWEPPNRLVHRSAEAEDGRIMTSAFEVGSRDGGGAWIRWVHSGFLPGDSWEDEYNALKSGDPAYLHKLGEYLRHFAGRHATATSFQMGPLVPGGEAPGIFGAALGLAGPIVVGSSVSAAIEGLPRLDGEVDYVSSDFLGVRTHDGLYRFIHGFTGETVLEYHLFGNVDAQATETAWGAWLGRALG